LKEQRNTTIRIRIGKAQKEGRKYIEKEIGEVNFYMYRKRRKKSSYFKNIQYKE
jgi:hypothetical protein